MEVAEVQVPEGLREEHTALVILRGVGMTAIDGEGDVVADHASDELQHEGEHQEPEQRRIILASCLTAERRQRQRQEHRRHEQRPPDVERASVPPG